MRSAEKILALVWVLANAVGCADADGATHFLQDCAVPSGASAVPATLAGTGCFSTDGTPSATLRAYTVNAPLYADGASKRRWMKLASAAPWDANGVLQPAPGSALFKEFSEDGVRVETRLLMRDAQGEWAGYSYAWSDDQTTATLFSADGGTATVNGHAWVVPSRADCLTCHNNVAERVLGPRQQQLNSDFHHLNQLTALAAEGVVAAVPSPLAAWPNPAGSAPLEQRARAYLAANCAHCHQPGGESGTTTDFRYDTPLAQMGICDVAPARGAYNIANARILAPGDPSRSMISVRMHSVTEGQRMPPLGRTTVDTDGVAWIDAWITSVTQCSPQQGT